MRNIVNIKNKSKILKQVDASGKNKHVLLLMGGESAEKEVSLSSGNGMLQSLINLGYKATAVDPGFDISTVIQELAPDVVLIALHGTFGEDGNIQGILNLLRIPYTHSGLTASAIAFNKIITRKLVEYNGIKMAKVMIYGTGDELPDAEPMARPFVIKPSCEGSSVGVEVIFDGDNFDIKKYDKSRYGEVLIEEYIPGQEINVAVIDGKAIGALELKTNRRFYDYEAKYTPGGSEHVYPANLPADKYQEVLSISEKIFKLLGCSDVARVEFRYNPDQGEFFFLEINTHPGFTPTSIVPEICMHNGITYDQLVELLVERAYAIKL